MTFTVIWKPKAELALAELWNSAQDRQAVTESADAMDSLLRTSPLEVGESPHGEHSHLDGVSPIRLLRCQ
jgi:hypothetical protein